LNKHKIIEHTLRGLYIYWKYPSPLGEKLSTRITWAKKIKRGRENGENVKEKGTKGKGKEKTRSKM
jgi:hypothetical protein